MKIYSAIMTLIISSIGAALVVPISQKLNEHFNIWFSVILAAIISSLIILMAKFIFLETPYLFKKTRRGLLPIAEMEGRWVEIVTQSGERVVSIANIKYDSCNKKHIYYGTAYDQNGIAKATWMSKHLSHESGDNIHAFTFTGEGTYKDSNQRIRTVGQVNFINTFKPHDLSRGYGAYYDYDVNPNNQNTIETKNIFDIYKLTSKDYMTYIGKKKPESENDWKQFVINYYKANVNSCENTVIKNKE